MSSTLANGLVALLGLYALAGVIFAFPFLLRGVSRIDPVASGSTWGFRVIVFPGVVALWPLLLRRWLAGAAPPEEKTAHRRAVGHAEPSEPGATS